MKNTGSFLFMVFVSFQMMAQTFSEKISKEYMFEKKSADNAIMVANINGHIKIEGYDGDKILLVVDKQIKAKTEERLEKGKQQIQLGVMDLADTLIFFIEGTGSEFGKKRDGRKGGSRNHYGYSSCCNGSNSNCNGDCNNCRSEFEYSMNFTIKVPKGVDVMASTINDGDVAVSKVTGKVSADNINGSITLKDLVRESYASTINGDVDIEYTANPQKDCRFYTLNGDINAWFQKGLAASMSFESFNGEFYTNIDKLEHLPVYVEKKQQGKGMKYKVSDNRFKIGSGGALLDFETFNGNVYLKEKTN
ncbi:MAG: hypothetical protein ABIS36_03840 [Chryseolinea sp.]